MHLKERLKIEYQSKEKKKAGFVDHQSSEITVLEEKFL